MSRALRGRRLPPTRRGDDPLTAEEIERLDRFLAGTGEDITEFIVLDGFITAIALLPDPLMPALWHGVIFGGADDGETATRVAAAEAVGILALLLRHWRNVMRRVAGRGWWDIPDAEEDTWLQEVGWAQGFLEGMYHTEDLWEVLITPDRYAEAVAPIRQIAERSLTGHVGPLPALAPEERAELSRQLVGAVKRLHREMRGRG